MYKIHQHISYINNKNKRITAKIIDICNSEYFNAGLRRLQIELGSTTLINWFNINTHYLVKTKNGHFVYKDISDQTLKLENNLLSEKLERILNEKI